MKIVACQQNSPEWFQARLGIPTASNFSRILAKGQGKTRRSYLYELAAEKLTGQHQDGYSNAAMEHGKNFEDEARKAYEFTHNIDVTQVGFMTLDDASAGASPDSLIADDGLLEIKCPKTTTHIDYLLSQKLPSAYVAQVQGQLWISERDWCDFISYDPRIFSNANLFQIKVHRDETYINDVLKPAIDSFNTELEGLLQKVA